MMTTQNDNGIIIDVHTHSGGMDISNFTRYKYPYCQDIIDLYEKGRNNNVSCQVVFSMPTTNYFDIPKYWETRRFVSSGQSNYPFETENKHLIQSIDSIISLKRNFIPFLSFSLQDKVEEQQESICELIKGYPDIKGIKYHTSCDQNPALMLEKKSEIVDIAKEFGMSFMIHTGFNGISDSMSVLALASNHPEVNFCAAHFGGFSESFFRA